MLEHRTTAKDVLAVRADSTHDFTSDRNHSNRYVWYATVLLSVVNVFNYMDRMALSVLLPSIKGDLRLSDGQLGLLVGFAFFLFYALCGIPIARWADRGIRRNIIATALATWSVMTALSGAAQNFWHLFAARLGVGAGEAGGLAPAQSILCDYVPLQRRPGVLALHSFGLYAGMMLGMALAGVLGVAVGWRMTFVVLGLPGIALALLVRFTLHEPRRGRLDAVQGENIGLSFGKTLELLWRCRTYRLLLIFGAVNGFTQFGMNQWWPSFYVRSFGLSLSWVGLYLGLAIGVGSAIGLLGGGILANKAAQRDVRLPLMIGVAATALALPAALGSLFIPSASASILLVSLVVLLCSVSAGPILGALYSVTVPAMRTTAGAINVFFASALGFGLGPSCVGLLSDTLAPWFGNQSLRYALLAPVCLFPAMIFVLYRATRQLPSDLRTIGERSRDETLPNSG